MFIHLCERCSIITIVTSKHFRERTSTLLFPISMMMIMVIMFMDMPVAMLVMMMIMIIIVVMIIMLIPVWFVLSNWLLMA